MSTTIIIKPAPGSRLVCPPGCLTLAGVPIPPRADLPAEGAKVPREVWAIRAIGRGDAVPVEPPSADPAPAETMAGTNPGKPARGSAPVVAAPSTPASPAPSGDGSAA